MGVFEDHEGGECLKVYLKTMRYLKAISEDNEGGECLKISERYI